MGSVASDEFFETGAARAGVGGSAQRRHPLSWEIHSCVITTVRSNAKAHPFPQTSCRNHQRFLRLVPRAVRELPLPARVLFNVWKCALVPDFLHGSLHGPIGCLHNLCWQQQHSQRDPSKRSGCQGSSHRLGFHPRIHSPAGGVTMPFRENAPPMLQRNRLTRGQTLRLPI